jgi:regulator of replication initiation timing
LNSTINELQRKLEGSKAKRQELEKECERLRKESDSVRSEMEKTKENAMALTSPSKEATESPSKLSLLELVSDIVFICSFGAECECVCFFCSNVVMNNLLVKRCN